MLKWQFTETLSSRTIKVYSIFTNIKKPTEIFNSIQNQLSEAKKQNKFIKFCIKQLFVSTFNSAQLIHEISPKFNQIKSN